MKKFLTLALLAVLAISTATEALAAPKDLEVKARGSWRFQFSFQNNFDFDEGNAEDDYFVAQRARVRFRFVWSENVMAEMYTEMGDVFWGDASTGGDIDTDERIIEIKRLFTQFKLPDTKIVTTIGLQDVSLPDAGYFNTMILGTDAGALVMSFPIDEMFALAMGYTRLADSRQGTLPSLSNEFDAIFAALPVTLDGFKITPWFTYAWLGADIGTQSQTTSLALDTSTATVGDVVSRTTSSGQAFLPQFRSLVTEDNHPWWIGLAFNMDLFDPFVVYADFTYGSAKDITGDVDLSGYFFDLALAYKGFKFFTPEIFGAYSSGVNEDDITDSDEPELGLMPYIRPQWGPAGTLSNNSSFTDDLGPATPGFWMIGLAMRDITFIEKLKHDLIFMYGQGTHEQDAVVNSSTVRTYLTNIIGGNFGHPFGKLTDEDSYWEIDFNHKYQIYEALALILELGYGSIDLDEQTEMYLGNLDDSLMKATLGLKFDF